MGNIMKNNLSQYKNYLINLIFPVVVFGGITGVLSGAVLVLYKFMANKITAASAFAYSYLKENICFVIIALILFFGIACLFSYIYKKIPNLKGGGIPTSIGMLRGKIRFKWFENLVGTFFMSLTSFLIGVPLGTEGPSVQMGTVLGRACSGDKLKSHRAWGRYTMTGGACAGFSTATGAPVSGILFAIEEAHNSVSPMIVMVSMVAVVTSNVTSKLLSPIFGITDSLFGKIDLAILDITKLWIPLLIGFVFGIFSVLYLRYYKLLNIIISKISAKRYMKYKIFVVFVLTLIFGLISQSFISTGHHLIDSLLKAPSSVMLLVSILLVRTTLTLSANITGITGGIFLPIMAIGATLASLIGNVSMSLGLDKDYYSLIIVLGIGACISGMMKMPLTAIVFSIEALSCSDNLLPVILTAITSYVITEIFNEKSINDSTLEKRLEHLNMGKECVVEEIFVSVKEGSFASGKEVRDIFWPSNMYILSIKRPEDEKADMSVHGSRILCTGDILHVRYTTYDIQATHKEIDEVLGNQDYSQTIDLHEIFDGFAKKHN
ncbi:MAG: hypothetical protein E7635_03865 [Ruminococcaceae bacterium]|nr:hypothetical protein [Oscillospiraceae bacterium]